MSNFSIFFPLDQKKSLRPKSTQVDSGSASYLLRVKSKFGWGRVGAHLYYICIEIKQGQESGINLLKFLDKINKC